MIRCLGSLGLSLSCFFLARPVSLSGLPSCRSLPARRFFFRPLAPLSLNKRCDCARTLNFFEDVSESWDFLVQSGAGGRVPRAARPGGWRSPSACLLPASAVWFVAGPRCLLVVHILFSVCFCAVQVQVVYHHQLTLTLAPPHHQLNPAV